MAIAAGVWPAGTAPAGPQQKQGLASKYDISATDFLPVSGPIMPDQLANSATGVDPQTRETMRKLYLQALNSFEAEARKNNMANAFAFVTAIALQIKTGKNLTETQADQLVVYFNNVLGSIPAFYTTNPRQQQLLYESLIITGNLIALLDSQGKQANNQQMRTQAIDMSQAVIKQFLGFDAK
jgi:nucleoside phosphorylase